jgi:hypothetical protein
MFKRRNFLIISIVNVLLCLIESMAAAEQAVSIPTTKAIFQNSYEILELPGGEDMGFWGGQFLYETTSGLLVGPAAYGAVTGDRGGFISLGAAADLNFPLTDSLSLSAGYFVGAGGGRGGYTLSGGGLMLRAKAGVEYSLHDYGILGFGISDVSFPNGSGSIDSTQPYLAYSYPFTTLHQSGWRDNSNTAFSGNVTSQSEQDFAVVFRSYKVPEGVPNDSGGTQHPTVDLVGVEWSQYLDENYFVKIESEGAMGGDSRGYMQIFLGGGYRFNLSEDSALKFSSSAGVAGGGGVDTGGGLLLDAQTSVQHQLWEGIFAEAGVGYVVAPQASFEALSLVAKLGYKFDSPSVSGSSVPVEALSGYSKHHFRLRLPSQRYLEADPNWRSHHSNLDVDNLGVLIDYFPHHNIFLTGQGLAAYTGEAGAYMTGLLGAGVHSPVFDDFYIEAEGLFGAAGGGGLETGAGLVWQVNANLGYNIDDSLSVTLGLGRMEAFEGKFKANVISFGLAYKFDLLLKAH